MKWDPIYWIWIDGLADSHNELNTHYSEMCEAPKRL